MEQCEGQQSRGGGVNGAMATGPGDPAPGPRNRGNVPVIHRARLRAGIVATAMLVTAGGIAPAATAAPRPTTAFAPRDATGVTTIDDPEQLAAFLAAHPKAVVEFYALWCGPCSAFVQKYEQDAARYDNIAFAKVDVDVDVDDAAQYNIASMPTFILFNKAQKFGQVTGANNVLLNTELLALSVL